MYSPSLVSLLPCLDFTSIVDRMFFRCKSRPQRQSHLQQQLTPGTGSRGRWRRRPPRYLPCPLSSATISPSSSPFLTPLGLLTQAKQKLQLFTAVNHDQSEDSEVPRPRSPCTTNSEPPCYKIGRKLRRTHRRHTECITTSHSVLFAVLHKIGRLIRHEMLRLRTPGTISRAFIILPSDKQYLSPNCWARQTLLPKHPLLVCIYLFFLHSLLCTFVTEHCYFHGQIV